MKVMGKIELEVDLMDVAQALATNPEAFTMFWRAFAYEAKGGRKTKEDPLGQRDPGVDLDPFIKAMVDNLNLQEMQPLLKIVDGLRYTIGRER